MIAVNPLRQTLLMVVAGTVHGSPAATAAWRAGFWPAPAWTTWPMRTWSTSESGDAGAVESAPDRDGPQGSGGQ